MKSFYAFVKESTDTIIAIADGMEYQVSETPRLTTIKILNKDRFLAKTEIEKRLASAGYQYSDGVKSSDSIDIKTTDVTIDGKKYRFFYKPKTGGSGAGAEITALGECFQAYACGARQAKGRPLESGEEVFEINPPEVEADRTLDQCRELPPEWINSGVVIANQFHSEQGSGTYKFHRGSQLVGLIEAEYQRLKREAGLKFDINKWNPSDIWAAKKNFRLKTGFKTLAEYNEYLINQFTEKNLMGVSLKKVDGSRAIKEVYNLDKPEFDIKLTNYQIQAAKKDFFSSDISKDVYLTYNQNRKEMKMQLRTFSAGLSGWQGEIKGKSAAGGKVGGGNLEEALVLAGIPRTAFIDQKAFKQLARNPTKQVFEQFIDMYLELSSGEKRKKSDLVGQAEILYKMKGKGASWFYSKYLSMQFVYTMIKYRKQDEVLRNIALIAASSTSVSSVFYKYS